jgi:hypothetical protein
MISAMCTTSQLISFFLLFALINLASAADKATVFGSTEADVSGLIGILYDLKQTQTRKRTSVDTEGYWGVLDQFLSEAWNESVLNQYFRATRPLYATQIFIPQIKADAAPKAFGVGDIVSASQWLVHYKGQVSAPRSGTFRFVGYSSELGSCSHQRVAGKGSHQQGVKQNSMGFERTRGPLGRERQNAKRGLDHVQSR